MRLPSPPGNERVFLRLVFKASTKTYRAL
jgi:hypothetical protein